MKRLPRVRIVVVFRAARGQLARFLTGSVAVHGALLTAVLIVPAARQRPVPIDDSMVVALVGPIPTATAPSGGSAPARTPVQKIQPAAPTLREVPNPKPKEKLVKIKKEPAKPPDAEKHSETPDPVETPPQPAPQRPPSPSPQSAIGGAVTATVGGGDSSLGWYGAAVKAALEAAWIKPLLEDAAGTASVVLAFDIARDGTPRNIRIETSSGIQSLDRSALRAATDVASFPAVPSTWTGDAIPVTMRFDLSPETR